MTCWQRRTRQHGILLIKMSDVTSQMEGIQIRTMERHPQNDTILLETIVNHLGVETTSNFHLKKKNESVSPEHPVGKHIKQSPH